MFGGYNEFVEPRTNTERHPTSSTLATERVVVPEGEKSRTEQMVDQGLDEMEKRYGEKSPSPKKYHNEQHVLRVVLAAEKIAKTEGLTEKEIDLLKIAAAWHDVELGMGGENESISAVLCADEMHKTGWSANEIEVVRRIILATRYFIKEDVIHQMVEDETEMIEEHRVGLMGRIIADADVSANGADWDIYKSCGLALGREVGRVGDGDEEGNEEFWKWQLGFLDGLLNERGGFYTQGAKKVFPHMAGNLEEARRRASPGGA